MTTDAATPDTLVATIYALLSGPKEQARDWDRFRSLYAPGALAWPVSAVGGVVSVDTFHALSYQASRTPIFAADDFYEREVGRRTLRFGNIVHVWSAYEARRSPDGVPFMRGVNSIQLLQRDGRWWILSAVWQNEHDDVRLPAEFIDT